MTTSEVLTLLIAVLFAVLFVAAAWRFVRRRTVVELFLMLMFGPLAALLVTQVAELAGIGVPDALSSALAVFLLAQPLFALGLAGRLIDLPRAVPIAAVAAFALTSGTFVALGAETPVPMIIAAVAVFASTELVAAAAILRSAGHRSGAARTRRQVMAWATVLLGVAIVVAGAGATIPPDADGPAWTETFVVVTELLALGSGLAYLVAVLPPVRLSRAWQAIGAYPEVVELLSHADETSVWTQLAEAGRRTTGARGVAIARVGLGGATMLGSVGLGEKARTIERALEALERRPGRRGGDAPVSVEFDPGGMDAHALAIRLDGGEAGSPLLIAIWDHLPLFGGDGRAMLEVLFRQAAILAERVSLSKAQERLTLDLQATVDELQRASRAKSEFLASMSHELRTPLNAILGFSGLMRDESHADGTLHVPPEWAEHVHRGGQHLLGLINDILDLSKVEAGRIELQPTVLDLEATMDESIQALRPLAAQKELHIETEVGEGLRVSADRSRFRQILYNLLSNAIKYTPEGGLIRVEAAEDPDWVTVSVIDTGVGIAPEDQERIFDAFWQAAAGNGRTDGTGLGLTLTRRLVEAHGGRLTLESTVGAGSRFSARFPIPTVGVVAPAPEAAARTPVAATPGSRVLVVEDDASTVRLLRSYLEPDGYALAVAATGEEAIQIARTERPDVILLDVLLPDIDGWEVLRRLKSDPDTRTVPVVFETVVDEPGVGIGLGAADYLVKPIDRGQLLAAIGRNTRNGSDGTRPRRVLAVDDEPADLDFVLATLRSAGYTAVGVTSGSEALQLATQDPPDVLVCDLIMPSPDGFEIIATLRDAPATAHLPIIVLTAHDLTPEERGRVNDRVVTVLAKTCGRDELLGWLARILSTPA